MSPQRYSPPTDTPLQRLGRQFLIPVVLVVALIAGGLAGAWGLPRATILLAPHAPRLVVYGSTVVGILAGGVFGVFVAEVLTRGFAALWRQASSR